MKKGYGSVEFEVFLDELENYLLKTDLLSQKSVESIQQMQDFRKRNKARQIMEHILDKRDKITNGFVGDEFIGIDGDEYRNKQEKNDKDVIEKNEAYQILQNIQKENNQEGFQADNTPNGEMLTNGENVFIHKVSDSENPLNNQKFEHTGDIRKKVEERVLVAKQHHPRRQRVRQSHKKRQIDLKKRHKKAKWLTARQPSRRNHKSSHEADWIDEEPLDSEHPKHTKINYKWQQNRKSSKRKFHFKQPKPSLLPDLFYPKIDKIDYTQSLDTSIVFEKQDDSYGNQFTLDINEHQIKRLKDYRSSMSFYLDLQKLSSYSMILPEEAKNQIAGCRPS